MSNIERRYFKATELRIDQENDSPVIRGFAALFNSMSVDLGGFREVIQPGAFTKSLETSDVRALVDHDSGKILGRTKSGTLRLYEDEKGLRVEIDPPNNNLGRDVLESLRRGDLDQMSFGFTLAPNGDEWRADESGNAIRELREIKDLVDVSIVAYPAYPETSVAVRSLQEWKASQVPTKRIHAEKFVNLIDRLSPEA